MRMPKTMYPKTKILTKKHKTIPPKTKNFKLKVKANKPQNQILNNRFNQALNCSVAKYDAIVWQ